MQRTDAPAPPRRSRSLRGVTLALIGLVVSCGGAALSISDPLPQGLEGPRAEALAQRSLKVIEAERFWAAGGARWRFAGHSYLWHRSAGRVRVELDEDEQVYLDLITGRARARCGGEELSAEELEEARREALEAFNNDSFWAFAPFKLLDSGTRRALVSSPEGEALLVSYDTGGSTPGDSYLWRFDEQGRPKAWQMWVQILPIGGLSASWEGWRQTRAGAWVATEHRFAGITLKLEDVELTERFEELDQPDPLLTEPW